MSYSIALHRISKRYRIGHRLPSLSEVFGRWKETNNEEYHWALKSINFSLKPGEALGIIGPNGAGKTTILKILSKVTYPTSGKVKVNGRLSSLIELGAGFHPDLTGKENIYLNGIILGLRKKEIDDRFERIVEFSGVKNFLATPVKRYSSGMYARLGFAIASHVEPEVLLVDEVLAVGDYAFQQKCYTRMEELRSNGTSLILVSHNMEAIRRVCDRGLVMYRGSGIFEGSAAEAVVAYSNVLRQAAREAKTNVPEEYGLSEKVMTFAAEIENVDVIDYTGKSAKVLRSGSQAKIIMDVFFNRSVHQPIFSCTIRAPDGRLVYDTTTQWQNIKTPDFILGEKCRVQFIMNLSLIDGEYEVGVDVGACDLSHYYDRIERAQVFWVEGNRGAKGLVDLMATIKIEKTK